MAAMRAVNQTVGRLAKLAANTNIAAAANDMWMIGKPVLRQAGGLALRELGPPGPGALSSVKADVSKMLKSAQGLKFLNVTVEQAVNKSVLAVEVACWFYIGEMLGRGSIIGYNV
eukprot:m.355679 g.355679  ORF g.355679 m.355679 type:complete len:115 (+) comp17305_c0_seq1:283-627(+)